MLPVEYQLKNKELVKLWVEALRSGRYQQIKGVLRQSLANGYGHCCLGVLCEVVKPLMSDNELVYLEESLKINAYPPKIVLKHLVDEGKRDIPISAVGLNEKLYAVYTLNDDLGMSFNEIADLLEQTHLKGDDGTTSSTEQVTT